MVGGKFFFNVNTNLASCSPSVNLVDRCFALRHANALRGTNLVLRTGTAVPTRTNLY